MHKIVTLSYMQEVSVFFTTFDKIARYHGKLADKYSILSYTNCFACFST